MGDWEDKYGNIIRNVFRYTYPKNKEKNLSLLQIHAIYTPASLVTIQRTYDLLRKGKVQEAYDAMDIPFCGSAFFTKFFYFSGYAIKDQFCYLILDSMVAKCLERLLGKSEIKNFCKVLRNKEGEITSVGKFAHGYKCYLDLMQFWAKKLDCSPDAIELFMFSQMRP